MLNTTDGRWQPGLGDPTVLGWVTVGAYLATTVILITAWRREVKAIDGAGGPSTRRATFWLWLALLFIVLSINKQLDLQSWFTQSLRDHAHAHGWYESRRNYQMGFIVTLGLLIAMAWVVALRALLPLDRARAVAVVGLFFLGGFVLTRAASFHYVDALIRDAWLGMRFNGWLELGGIATVAYGARLVRPRSLSPP